MSETVRHMNPYRETAIAYHKSNWFGVLPLPHKEKHPPPTGYTGHRAPYPDAEKIKEWRTDGKRHNIGLRLAGVDKEHEIIGIDVDHYHKAGKDKKGGDQLQVLEAQLGALPDTWISSSRTDGISGIRYYLVPRGMAFRGQVDKDIECINKGYRFAVVWPSVHPSGETYWWFPPGIPPSESGRGIWDGSDLPNAADLPELPEKWLDYLTQNRMMADVDVRIDNDISADGVYEWAYGLFHGDPDSDHVCRLYRNKVDKQIKDILNEATSHDKIVKAHYNLLRLAAEGHTGWTQALLEVETAWTDDVIKRDKRGPEELRNEVWRSRTNALRKIKAQIDERIKIGAQPVDPCCELPGGICEVTGSESGDAKGDDPPPDDPLDDIPRGAVLPVNEYELNDDGNAAHFVDMFSNLKMGPAVRYVDGLGWIIWHEGKGDDQPHWVIDREGDQEMRRMWWKVKERQQSRVEVLKQDWVTKCDQYDQNVPGVSKSDVELAKSLYREFKAFAEKSGNNFTANNAIRAVKSRGTQISVNDLDSKKLLLGVKDGVLELSNDDITLRKAKPDDYITMNTGIPYGEKPSDLSVNTWNEYLETFLPDIELRNIVQIVMGYTIIGGNPQKKIIILKGDPHTGKSTMIDGIQAALGDYAAPINETVFQSSQFSEVLVNVLNKRVAHVSEFDPTIELSAAVVKRLTGGDTISQAIKYSNEVREGQPHFTVILGTNQVPKIADADKALYERLYVIPFETVPIKMDTNQREVVKTLCGPAVLHWLVEGYKRYSLTKTLPLSKLIKDKTDEFMADLDETATFIEEALVKHDKIGMRIDWKNEPDWCIRRTEVYKHYESWCEINKISERNRLKPHGLTKRLRSLGVPGTSGSRSERVGTESSTWWYGIKLRKLRRAANVFQMPKMGSEVTQSHTE